MGVACRYRSSTPPGRVGCCLIVLGLLLGGGRTLAADAPPALHVDEVVRAVTDEYPPLLAALIERDIRDGRLRGSLGAFDLEAFIKVYGSPAGYYRFGTLDTGFEQFTGVWGSTIFGGYRLTWGEILPQYYWNRTEEGGEPSIGVKVPLLRNGQIDKRRAAILKAELDRDQADPFIRRQQLDFVRAGTIAYFNWLAAGQRLRYADELLRVARERGEALQTQHGRGLVPKIVLTDNQRLVVSRELSVTKARRSLEAAALLLSLFVRDDAGNPIVVGRDRLPDDFPPVTPPPGGDLDDDVTLALARRPELERMRLERKKVDVDLQLAQNQMLPQLDVATAASQDVGGKRYFDLVPFELKTGIELRMPIQRREAQGQVMEAQGRLAQIDNDLRFAQDRIATEVRDAHSALSAAWEQIDLVRLNVTLARELESAEQERFRLGASDLLAVQIREQAAFDAEVVAADAFLEYFKARADFDAALNAPPPRSRTDATAVSR